MLRMTIRRRQLLQGSLYLGLYSVFAPALKGCGATEVCAAPDQLSTGEQRMREKLEYVEVAAGGAAGECGSCRFFQVPSGSQGACGTCQIFSGPVNRRGTCTSWAT